MKLTPFSEHPIAGDLTKPQLLKKWRQGYATLYDEEYPYPSGNLKAAWFTQNYTALATLMNLNNWSLNDVEQFFYWIWNWEAPRMDWKIKMIGQVVKFTDKYKRWLKQTARYRAEVGTAEFCRIYLAKNYSDLRYGKERILEWIKQRKQAESA